MDKELQKNHKHKDQKEKHNEKHKEKDQQKEIDKEQKRQEKEKRKADKCQEREERKKNKQGKHQESSPESSSDEDLNKDQVEVESQNNALLQKLINLRHQIHQHPQVGFKQFETKNKIVNILKQFGVREDQMIKLTHQRYPNFTALVVDLKGKAAPSGNPKCVAFRADMDALPMNENNPQLEYRSQVQGVGHMCGHDGHVVCLVAFVPKFLAHIDKIPSDKTIRLLFQPAEEGPESGARLMIEKGCLNGVDEVYGFHNAPSDPIGFLRCKEGAVMSEVTVLNITIKGTGGHGSSPQGLKQSLRAAVRFYQRAMDYFDNHQKSKQGLFVCTLPVFHAGQIFNVISQDVFISGTIRSLEKDLNKEIVKELTNYLEDLKKEGFSYDFHHNTDGPLLRNHKKQAEHVLRIGKKVFGNDNADGKDLPSKASEDFGYFTDIKPGAYFFLTSHKGKDQGIIHSKNFDFNDQLIQPASKIWWELAKDRLEIN